MFSGFGLKPPASGFHFIFTVVSRVFLLYISFDKTSRLKMKSFSTVRDSWRGSQSYMEKRRGQEGDRGHQEEKRGNQKKREPASQ